MTGPRSWQRAAPGRPSSRGPRSSLAVSGGHLRVLPRGPFARAAPCSAAGFVRAHARGKNRKAREQTEFAVFDFRAGEIQVTLSQPCKTCITCVYDVVHSPPFPQFRSSFSAEEGHPIPGGPSRPPLPHGLVPQPPSCCFLCLRIRLFETFFIKGNCTICDFLGLVSFT